MGRARKILLLGLVTAAAAAGLTGYVLFHRMAATLPRSTRLGTFFADPEGHQDWVIAAGSRCGTAPLVFPSNGYVGFLWDDSWKAGHRHQGIDIFSPALTPGQTPVYAAYDGFLNRPADWKSTVIVRVPDDPLQPGRQIWMYYTHMADQSGSSFISTDFPPGTMDMPITAGTLLGYQGNYSGTPDNPTGVHLHFSIVSDDGSGRYRNELDIRNTLDPSPYLGLNLNADKAGTGVVTCPDSSD